MLTRKRLHNDVLTYIYRPGIFAEKIKIMEKDSVPTLAKQRYIKTIEGYKERLKSNVDLRLTDYCKECNTDYRQLIYWMSHHHISVRRLQSEARGESSLSEASQTFIQFTPSRRPLSCDLRGVSITFPDGVNLTLQESSVESVINLLTIYQSRRGGAEQCSL